MIQQQPIYLLNKNKQEVARLNLRYKCCKGLYRYTINPNSSENTYSLESCLSLGWEPVYSKLLDK